MIFRFFILTRKQNLLKNKGKLYLICLSNKMPESAPSLRSIAKYWAGNRCSICGDPDELTVHHIKPLESGGENEIANLDVLCMVCHAIVHTYLKAGVDPYEIKNEVMEKSGKEKWGMY